MCAFQLCLRFCDDAKEEQDLPVPTHRGNSTYEYFTEKLLIFAYLLFCLCPCAVDPLAKAGAAKYGEDLCCGLSMFSSNRRYFAMSLFFFGIERNFKGTQLFPPDST